MTTSTSVEALMKDFLSMEVDKNGFVDRKALEAFYAKQGHDKEAIEQWMHRFKDDRNGKITFTEFINALGVRPDEMKTIKSQLMEEKSGKKIVLNPKVEVLASTMTRQMQKIVSDKFVSLVDAASNKKGGEGSIPEAIKQFMEAQFHPTWHCMVLEGSYWLHYMHEPFTSLNIRYNNKILIVWRTPTN